MLRRAWRYGNRTKWALKSVPIFDSSEVISALIDKGDDLLSDVAFCTYWFLEELFYMACRIDNDDSINLGNAYKQRCFEVVSKIFETVYQNDDMGFEQLQHLYNLHQGIAGREADGGKMKISCAAILNAPWNVVKNQYR